MDKRTCTYEAQLKYGIMLCLQCGEKIKYRQKGNYETYQDYYICSNHKLCPGKSSTEPAKKVDIAIVEQFKQFYDKYIQHKKDSSQIGKVTDYEHRLSDLYKQKVEFYNKVNEYYKNANYPFEPIVGPVSKEAKDDDDKRISEIEEEIELVTWLMYFDNNSQIKDIDMLKFARIELNLTDDYGVVKFLNPTLFGDIHMEIIFGWDQYE